MQFNLLSKSLNFLSMINTSSNIDIDSRSLLSRHTFHSSFCGC